MLTRTRRLAIAAVMAAAAAATAVAVVPSQASHDAVSGPPMCCSPIGAGR